MIWRKPRQSAVPAVWLSLCWVLLLLQKQILHAVFRESFSCSFSSILILLIISPPLLLLFAPACFTLLFPAALIDSSPVTPAPMLGNGITYPMHYATQWFEGVGFCSRARSAAIPAEPPVHWEDPSGAEPLTDMRNVASLISETSLATRHFASDMSTAGKSKHAQKGFLAMAVTQIPQTDTDWGQLSQKYWNELIIYPAGFHVI